MGHLSIQGVRLEYQRQTDDSRFLALDTVNLEVDAGKFVTIVGPSGCGKSSLLTMVNGLLKPTSGSIWLNDQEVKEPGPERALVFQEFALLPWRTVLANVELGLELQGVPPKARQEIARRNVRLVGLTAFEHYLPHQLSGGMRQRAGIARALSVNPEVLLMDEPFGALDAQTRLVMATELLKIWERDRKTILFVTHDIDEAVYLADSVVVMSASPGRILQVMDINLARPRLPEVRNSAVFTEYRAQIWRSLEDEVRKSLAWQFDEAPA